MHIAHAVVHKKAQFTYLNKNLAKLSTLVDIATQVKNLHNYLQYMYVCVKSICSYFTEYSS